MFNAPGGCFEDFEMKFFYAAVVFAFSDGFITDDCVKIRSMNYEKHVLINDISNPYQLVIDHNTNTLFYSYTERASTDMFKSAYLDLSTGASGTINGIKGGFAHAVNNINNIVYIGGEDGLYKFDYNTITATNLHIKDNVNIWHMFYNDGLYFTTFPDERGYFYKNYQVVKLHALENVKAMMIAADKNKNIVYFNSSGVFLNERSTGKTIFLSEVIANGVTSDRYGNIVFSTLNGIYYVILTNNQVRRVANIDNIYGIAVEYDGDIIYAAETSIIRLKPTTKDCQPSRQRMRAPEQNTIEVLTTTPTPTMTTTTTTTTTTTRTTTMKKKTKKTEKMKDRIIEINIGE